MTYGHLGYGHLDSRVCEQGILCDHRRPGKVIRTVEYRSTRFFSLLEFSVIYFETNRLSNLLNILLRPNHRIN